MCCREEKKKQNGWDKNHLAGTIGLHFINFLTNFLAIVLKTVILVYEWLQVVIHVYYKIYAVNKQIKLDSDTTRAGLRSPQSLAAHINLKQKCNGAQSILYYAKI